VRGLKAFLRASICTIEKLRSRSIGFRSLTEAIDTTTAEGVLVFHMFSALAESSSELSFGSARAPGLRQRSERAA
jgi:DNA invertase Pin-like site-specific DNA recombinase